MNNNIHTSKVKYSRKRIRVGLLEYVFYWTMAQQFKYDDATIENINQLIQDDRLSDKPQHMRLINKLLELKQPCQCQQ